MPATKASTVSSSHLQARRSHSYPVRTYTDEETSRSSYSDASDLIKYPCVEGIREIRAEAINKSPERRRKEADKNVRSHTPRRTQSDSRRYVTKEMVQPVDKLRRKPDSEHRHRSQMSSKGRDWVSGEAVHASKAHKGSGGEGARVRPSDLRRSRTTGEASRPTPERSHRDEAGTARRQSERRASHQEERIRTPLRREKRTIAGTAENGVKAEAPTRRSTSVVESRTPSLLRPFLKRSQTSARSPPTARSSSYVPLPGSTSKLREKTERVPSIRGSRVEDRSSSIFSFMAVPKTSDRQKPEERVTCTTCLSDDVRISKCPKLSCSHRMCHSCLRRIFNLSVTDSQHMPPKCCTEDCIPLEHVVKLFDNNFKIKWNRKYQEFTTKNRIYCPAKRCGEWIKPAHIHSDASGGANHGRKYGKCQRCQTKVCCLCNNKWHTTRECPKDAATQEFIKIAKKEGWQSCYNCKATVEKIEGCNHMTCRCGAQFCLICGTKWKGCACLWFDEQAYDENIAYGGGAFPQAHNYQEEIDRRRRQELEDEALARNMELRNNPVDFNPWEDFGNAAPHFLNEDFRRRAADVLLANLNRVEEVRQQQRHEPAPRPQPQQEQRQRPLRQHSAASRQYNQERRTDRPNERVVPRRVVSDYASEAERHRPVARGGRASMLAGIERGQTGDGRVDEWRRHVDPLI